MAKSRSAHGSISGIADLTAAKEVALSEQRHRFANDLQLLSALVRLRQRQASDSQLRQELGSILDLVATLRRVKHQLAEAADGPTFASYLTVQMQLWRPLASEAGVSILIDLDDIAVPTGAAVPLALIAKELVTNALEHAFPCEESGYVQITLKPADGGWGVLTVADNGVGLPVGATRAGTLGLTIIDRLAARLGGTVSFKSSGAGVTARVRFPLASTTA